MIYLYSGTPGSGKTAHAVLEMYNLLKRDKPPPIYVLGIDHLKLTHTVITEKEISDIRSFPPNAHIFIDEAARYFGTQAKKSTDIKGFSGLGGDSKDGSYPIDYDGFRMHRHDGLTLYLICQDQIMLVPDIRRAIGIQRYFVKTWSGYYMIETPDTTSNPLSKRNSVFAARKRVSLPKHVFPLYESASVHVKNKVTKPPIVFFYTFLFLASVVGVFWKFGALTDLINRKDATVNEQLQDEADLSVSSDDSLLAYPASSLSSDSLSLDATSDLSASYSVEPVELSGCGSYKNQCRCYDVNGAVADVPYNDCLSHVEGHLDLPIYPSSTFEASTSFTSP